MDIRIRIEPFIISIYGNGTAEEIRTDFDKITVNVDSHVVYLETIPRTDDALHKAVGIGIAIAMKVSERNADWK